jgi:hypothetical protein
MTNLNFLNKKPKKPSEEITNEIVKNKQLKSLEGKRKKAKETEFEKIKANISFLDSQKKSLEAKTASKQLEFKEKPDKLKALITTLDTLKKEKDAVEKELEKGQLELATLKSESDTFSEEVEKLKEKKLADPTYDTAGLEEIEKQQKKNEADIRLNDKISVIDRLIDTLNEYKDKIESTTKISDRLKRDIDEGVDVKEIDRLKKENKEIEDEIKKFQSDKRNLETVAKGHESKVDNYKEKIKQLKDKREELEIEENKSLTMRKVDNMLRNMGERAPGRVKTFGVAALLALSAFLIKSRIDNYSSNKNTKPGTEKEAPRVKEEIKEEAVPEEEYIDEDQGLEEKPTTANYEDGFQKPKKEKHKREGRYEDADENIQEEAPSGTIFQNGKAYSVDGSGNVREYNNKLSIGDEAQIEASKHLKRGLCIKKEKDGGNYAICNLDGTPFYSSPNNSPFIN